MKRTIRYLKRRKIFQPTEMNSFMMVTLGKVLLKRNCLSPQTEEVKICTLQKYHSLTAPENSLGPSPQIHEPRELVGELSKGQVIGY